MDMAENPMVIDSLWHDWLSDGDTPDPWEKYMDVGEMVNFLDESGYGAVELESHIEYDDDDDLLVALYCNSNYLRGADGLRGLGKDDDVATHVWDWLEANWETVDWKDLWESCPEKTVEELARKCIKAESYRDEYNEKKWREE